MPKRQPETPACPTCARLEKVWSGFQQFERPQCLRCFRMEHGRPLLVPPALTAVERPMIRVRTPISARQVDHRYRMLEHLRRQAQIAARRVLEAAG